MESTSFRPEFFLITDQNICKESLLKKKPNINNINIYDSKESIVKMKNWYHFYF